MDNLLAGILGFIIYLGNILVTGATEIECLQSLEVLNDSREQKRVNLFMVSSISYLGHKIDAKGIHPLPEKLQAMKAAPTPRNVSELKFYLGLLKYYGKFLPTRLQLLYQLLAKDCQ